MFVFGGARPRTFFRSQAFGVNKYLSFLSSAQREPNDPIVKWKREFSRSHFVTESIAVLPIMLMTVIRQRPQELHQIALF